MKTWKLVTAISVALVAALWLWLRLLTWEPSGVEQGTIAYWLKVPSAIRSMRLWHAQGRPRYDVRVGDGPVPAYVRIRYQASGGLSALQDTVVIDGFTCKRDSAELLCERRRGAGYDQIYAKYDWQSDAVAVRAELTAL